MKAKLVLSAALATAALPAHAGKADVYALVGAKIVTVSGATLDGATLVMRDGVIEAVGAGVTAPPDARVIDAKGLTLTPGLIDGFGGVGLPQAARAGAGGGGGGAGGGGAAGGQAAGGPTLSPQSLALDRIRVADALRARDAGITSALVIGREGVLPGQSVLINLSGDKVEGMVLKQPAALHLHMATLQRQYPSALMGTMAMARQALLDAAYYRDQWAAYEKSPRGRARPKYEAAKAAWQEVLAGRETLIVTATRENDIRRALALQDEFKLKVAVAGAPQAFRVAALIKERKLPLLVTVNFDPPRAAGFGGGGGGFGGGADEERERKDIEEAERNPAELHKAGVPFALVSGHAPSFVAGLRKAIERGLPREAALKAATLAAAEVLGVADRTGSLEPGKLANVVAWSGEPLTREAKAKMVFVDGQLYEPSEEERPQGGPGRPTPGQEQEVIR
jgi:imidazolonepropionase-like amidohydrolase